VECVLYIFLVECVLYIFSGIGTKSLGSGISYARGKDGARLFFRQTKNGIEILGKSNKANEQTVINEVLKTFGK